MDFEACKCYNYKKFKKKSENENLFVKITKFRVSNHKLPIERGRYDSLERSERKCSMCHVLEE